MMRINLLLLNIFFMTLIGNSASAEQLKSVVDSDFRQINNTQRDEYRHPIQTLSFFDIKQTDTVIELWPGSGWYAEILGPYLAQKGHYIAGNFDVNGEETAFTVRAGKKFEAWINKNSAHLGHISTVAFQPPKLIKLGNKESVDAVLTFRNLHNWAKIHQLQAVFESSYQVLKKGGTFGVVEHRAKPNMDIDSGYMSQLEVIKLAEKVGFKLVATSEINANPKDTKNYANGVWTLPPTLALGNKEKEKYLAIGESDRMTLRFIK